MKRRTFLGAIVGALTAPVVLPHLPKPTNAATGIVAAPRGMVWADSGLPTRIIATGEQMPAAMAIIQSHFQKALWPGVNKFFEEHYKNIK